MSASHVMVGVVFALSAAMVGHTLLDDDGWQRRHRLQKDLRTLTLRNQHLQDTLGALGAEVMALNGHPQAQEHAIRDELGWVRSDAELVIQFDD